MTSTHEAALETIESHIGYLNSAGRAATLAAIEQDVDGCLALAEKTAKRKDVKNPTGLYLACLAAGEHIQRTPEDRKPVRIAPAEALRRLYNAKMRDLREQTNWTPSAMKEYAIDYACSSIDRCQIGTYPPGGIIALENELRAELGQPRYPAQVKAS